MNGENRSKFVEFSAYCPTCKHEDKKESEDPCYDCLDNPTNIDSHKPVNWEQK
jgi:hypothetical protein